MLCKSTDWFLYDGNIGRYRVNSIFIGTIANILANIYACVKKLGY